jgi:hypothetical protein
VSAYYFLIAQLPQLNYGQTPPMSPEAFKELAQTKLSVQDAALLDYCTLGATVIEEKPTPSAFINEWRKRERTLTFNLAQARVAKLKREGISAGFDVPHDSVDAENQAKTAVGMENPLEAELFLDKGRWDAIEDLTGVTYFDVNVIYAYLLKLKLIARKASFTTEEGFAEYKALYASIMESAPKVGAAGDSE